MKKITKKVEPKKDKKNFFELMTEFFGWIEILVSITLLSGMLGFLVFLIKQNTLTLIFGITIASSGLVLGIIYATKIWRKRGTVDFVSQVSASPELDNLEPPQ